MSEISRRKLIAGGIAAAAGASSIAVAARLAKKYGLVPPDHGGLYGPGETLNYAFQRLFARHSLAREFSRSQISPRPFPNEIAPLNNDFKRLQADGFVNWHLTIDGLVAKPTTFSLADLQRFPSRSQITEVTCEEGWSYVAEWVGVPLAHVLDVVGVQPHAKYVAYFSFEPDWWDSVDLDEALHPQTFLTYGMNGDTLPVGNGGPLRLRVPRQVGYKSVKFITRLTLVDDLKKFRNGLGSAAPEGGYAWFAGI